MKTQLIKKQVKQLERGMFTIERKLGDAIATEYLVGRTTSPERIAFLEATLGDMQHEVTSLRRALKALH